MAVRPVFRFQADDDDLSRPRQADAAARSKIFDELHHRYFDDIRRYVRRRVRDDDIAEDVAQETFLRAFRYVDALNTDLPTWPWLQTIAHNLMLNKLRDERRLRRRIVLGDC